MNVVLDTNIIISALLNLDGNIAAVLLTKRNQIKFYSVLDLKKEISRHKEKIILYSGFSSTQFSKSVKILYSKITFIPVNDISSKVINEATLLTKDVDLDDMYFVALASHLKAKLWSGDKKLMEKLRQKGYKRFITTQELYKYTYKKT